MLIRIAFALPLLLACGDAGMASLDLGDPGADSGADAQPGGLDAGADTGSGGAGGGIGGSAGGSGGAPHCWVDITTGQMQCEGEGQGGMGGTAAGGAGGAGGMHPTCGVLRSIEISTDGPCWTPECLRGYTGGASSAVVYVENRSNRWDPGKIDGCTVGILVAVSGSDVAAIDPAEDTCTGATLGPGERCVFRVQGAKDGFVAKVCQTGAPGVIAQSCVSQSASPTP